MLADGVQQLSSSHFRHDNVADQQMNRFRAGLCHVNRGRWLWQSTTVRRSSPAESMSVGQYRFPATVRMEGSFSSSSKLMTNLCNELRFGHLVGGFDLNTGWSRSAFGNSLLQMRTSFPGTTNVDGVTASNVRNDFIVKPGQFAAFLSFPTAVIRDLQWFERTIGAISGPAFLRFHARFDSNTALVCSGKRDDNRFAPINPDTNAFCHDFLRSHKNVTCWRTAVTHLAI